MVWNLNEWLWVCFIFATAINWLAPGWHFDWKKTATNFLVVALAYLITEFAPMLDKQPATIWGTLFYIIGELVVAVSPADVFKLITGKGWEVFQSKVDQIASKYKSKETEIITDKDKVVTTEKTTETIVQPKE